MSDLTEATWCPEHGPGVTVDEDHLCVTCGATASGDGADEALALRDRIESLEAQLTAANEEQSRNLAKSEARWAALSRAYIEMDALRAELQAANARADAATKRAIEQERLRIEEFDYLCDGRIKDDDIRLALVTSNRERDALRADLARVTAERDELDVRWKAEVDHANTWAARYRAESSDLAAARQDAEALRGALLAVRVDVASDRTWCRLCRTESRSEGCSRSNHPHADGCVLSAAPAPATDLAFGPPRDEGVRNATAFDERVYGVRPTDGIDDDPEIDGPWMWWLVGSSDSFDCVATEAEAIAAANEHNRARLAARGT